MALLDHDARNAFARFSAVVTANQDVASKVRIEPRPVAGAMRVGELPDEARPPHPGLPNHRSHLAAPSPCALQSPAEEFDLGIAANEASQSSGCGDRDGGPLEAVLAVPHIVAADGRAPCPSRPRSDTTRIDTSGPDPSGALVYSGSRGYGYRTDGRVRSRRNHYLPAGKTVTRAGLRAHAAARRAESTWPTILGWPAAERGGPASVFTPLTPHGRNADESAVSRLRLAQ